MVMVIEEEKTVPSDTSETQMLQCAGYTVEQLRLMVQQIDPEQIGLQGRDKNRFLIIHVLEWLFKLWPRFKLPGISHPFFVPEIRGFVAQLFATQSLLSEIYRKNGSAYQFVHLVSSSVLPYDLHPSMLLADYHALRTKKRFPYLTLPAESFSPESKWMANDERSRVQMARQVYEYLQKSDKNNLKIIDFGAGPGLLTRELIHLLQQHPLEGKEVRILCVEPAESVRDVGSKELQALVEWNTSISVEYTPYDFLSEQEVPEDLVESDVVMSSFVIGALKAADISAAISKLVEKLYSSLSFGGMLIVRDFATPPSRAEVPDDDAATHGYLDLTEIALFQHLGYLKVLENIYRSWEHNLENFTQFSAQLKDIFGDQLQISNHPRLLTVLLFMLKGDKVTGLPLVGYLEQQIRVEK